MNRNYVLKRLCCYLFAIVFVLAGWHISALIINKPALPTPLETIPVFIKYATALWPDFQISFFRLVASLLLGTVLALPIGLFLGRSKRFDALFGLGGAPKIALVTLTIFFQVVMVMRDAAKAVPEQMLTSVESLGGSRWQLWRHVIIPATLPELFTTLRVSSAVAIAVLFFAEVFAGSTGLGYFIMNSWSMVNYPRMFAGIIALAILGVIVYEAFDVVERRLTRYKRASL